MAVADLGLQKLSLARYGISVVAWPGLVIEMMPSQVQLHFETSSSAGMLAIITVDAPGAHGAGIAGTHGMGVSTPAAAVVAVAVAGKVGALQAPNGMIFNMGLWSMMLAAGWLPQLTLFTGRTIRDEGAAPKLHDNIALFTT